MAMGGSGHAISGASASAIGASAISGSMNPLSNAFKRSDLGNSSSTNLLQMTQQETPRYANESGTKKTSGSKQGGDEQMEQKLKGMISEWQT